MALESLGLGAILSFSSGNALAGIQQVAASFRNLGDSAGRVSAGLGQVGKALGAAALATAPLLLAMKAGQNVAAHFEQQMADLKAATEAGPEAMSKFSAEAKRLGATTKFTAVQAGSAMEILAKQGFTTQEVLEGTQGVLNAAAAEGIELAVAADIVASALVGLGRPAAEATKFADILAKASTETGASMVGLGESMKFVAPGARQLKAPMEDVMAVLGKLGDAGIRGEMAGAGLNMALSRMAAPTDKAAALMADLGIAIQKNAKGETDLVATAENLSGAFRTLKTDEERMAVAAKIFGREQARIGLIMAQSSQDAGDGRKTLGQLREELLHADKAAEKMADTRMDTFLGQVELLSSAVEGLSLEIFEPFLKSSSFGLKKISTFISDIVQVIQLLRGETGATEEETAKMAEAWNKTGNMARLVGIGISDGIDKVLGGIQMLREEFARLGEEAGGFINPDTISKIASIAVQFSFAAAAIVPALGALAAFGMLIKAVIIPAVVGLFNIVVGAAGILLGPVGLALAGIVALIFAYQKDTETFLQTALRLWGNVTDAVVNFWNTAIKPLWEGIKEGLTPAIEDLKVIWMNVAFEVQQLWLDLVELFGGGTDAMQTDWLEVGRTIGAIIGAVAGAIGDVVRLGVHSFRRVIGIVEQFKDAVKTIFSGDVLAGFKKLGHAILDFFLMPIRNVTMAMIKLADSIPGGSKLVPDSLREFAEEGIKARAFNMEADVASRTGVAANNAFSMEADSQSRTPTVNVAAPIVPPANIKVEAKLQLDGRDVSAAVKKNQVEFLERNGAKATPFQRRALVEFNALPMRGG